MSGVSQLALNDEVFFCVSEGQGIFLDLARDDYSAVPIPLEHASSGDCFSDEALAAVFELHQRELLEAHLLKKCARSSPGFQAFRAITRSVGHIFDPDDQRAFGLPGSSDQSVQLRFADVARFSRASARATRLLKNGHIHDIVSAVRMRKAGRKESNSVDEIRRQTAVFRRLRPWYPASYLCIFDALALIEFLALKKIYPTWVFGVQAQPFGAHCWVQQADQLLNESTEYVGQFTPIMAI